MKKFILLYMALLLIAGCEKNYSVEDLKRCKIKGRSVFFQENLFRNLKIVKMFSNQIMNCFYRQSLILQIVNTTFNENIYSNNKF